jgi:hypothetical protein
MEQLEGRSCSLISQVEKHAREKVELHINICPHLAGAFTQNSPAADRAVTCSQPSFVAIETLRVAMGREDGQGKWRMN